MANKSNLQMQSRISLFCKPVDIRGLYKVSVMVFGFSKIRSHEWNWSGCDFGKLKPCRATFTLAAAANMTNFNVIFIVFFSNFSVHKEKVQQQ